MTELVLSPHLDDGVLGMGEAIASMTDVVVATVFAGDPGRSSASSAWDHDVAPRASTVLAVRRREDRRALRRVGATGVHLGFFEAPYRTTARSHEVPTADEVFTALRREVVALLDTYSPVTLCVPLGVGHVDHMLCSAAAISAWLERRGCRLLAYAEQPYATSRAWLTTDRLRQLRASAVPARFDCRRAHALAKREAVALYTSQVPALRRAFVGWEVGSGEESCWWLHFDEALGRRPRLREDGV